MLKRRCILPKVGAVDNGARPQHIHTAVESHGRRVQVRALLLADFEPQVLSGGPLGPPLCCAAGANIDAAD